MRPPSRFLNRKTQRFDGWVLSFPDLGDRLGGSCLAGCAASGKRRLKLRSTDGLPASARFFSACRKALIESTKPQQALLLHALCPAGARLSASKLTSAVPHENRPPLHRWRRAFRSARHKCPVRSARHATLAARLGGCALERSVQAVHAQRCGCRGRERRGAREPAARGTGGSADFSAAQVKGQRRTRCIGAPGQRARHRQRRRGAMPRRRQRK